MSLQLNQNEYGQVLRVDLGEDISSATDLSFTLQPKFGDSIEKTDLTGVTVGTSNVEVGDSTYLANQYLEYTIEPTNLDFTGQFRMKGTATLSATNKVVSDFQYITVLE